MPAPLPTGVCHGIRSGPGNMRAYLLLSSSTISLAVCLLVFLGLGAHRDGGVHSAELKGNQETCDVNGETVELSDTLKMKCFQCTCKNGFVECAKKQCPSIDGCHVLEDPKLDQCCAKCKVDFARQRNQLKPCNRSTIVDHNEVFTRLKIEKDYGLQYSTMHITIWVHAGINVSSKGIPLHNITEQYTANFRSILPALHYLTGADYTSKIRIKFSALNEEPEKYLLEFAKGCTKEGVYHESGSSWTAAKNPCKALTCIAGVITESPVRCYTPCHSPIPPAPGQCCPTCPDCHVNGKYIKEETPVMPKQDPCVMGYCTSGLLTCEKKTCPVLNCPPSKLVSLSGECCPRCLGSGKYMNPPKGACLFGTTVHQSGEQFTLDDCTHCVCDNSTLVCEKKSCPILECDYKRQEILPGRCCAQCKEVDAAVDEDEGSDNDSEDYRLKIYEQEDSGNCTYYEKTYASGEIWNTTKCETCSCNLGSVKCSPVLCPAINCSSNLMLTIPNGQCCPICTESQGVCTVFGGTHFRTFDGKAFAFVGSCKYELASDCDSETFRILLKNNVVGNEASMRRISLKFAGVRVELQYNKNTKVNDEIIDLPFRLSDTLFISGSSENVAVTTKIGIRMQWNYVGFFEVIVPKSYRKKLCGLCGNFNSLPDDDLITREGISVDEPTVFAQSWTTGDDECLDTRKYGVRGCNPQKDKRLCSYIKGSVFSKCLKKISVTSYYENCLKDMCQCTPDDLQCHCESFTNYVRDCRRLGILLPRWRKSVGC